MTVPVPPFEPGAALARVVATPMGYRIDCRGSYGARHYDFTTVEETAEFIVVLYDEGGWQPRYGAGAESVRDLVIEITLEGEE